MRESIWYKANIVNAETLIPEVKSKILYVDLFNQEGVIVKRNRHYIKEGMCSGEFLSSRHIKCRILRSTRIHCMDVEFRKNP